MYGWQTSRWYALEGNIELEMSFPSRLKPLCVIGQLTCVCFNLFEVGLSLTTVQTAPSLAFATILDAHLTKVGIGLGSSLRQRATANNWAGEIKLL